MNMFKSVSAAAVTALVAGLAYLPVANAEPLAASFEFSKSAYADTLKTNSIVVTINKNDQDPDAKDTEPFTVDCKLIPGSAVENEDYRLSFQWPASGVWQAKFPPGVTSQSFTIYTIKKPGPNKTLHFALGNVEGPRATVTGSNPTANITIVNPPPPPPDKKS
jgi:hypothetical protein